MRAAAGTVIRFLRAGLGGAALALGLAACAAQPPVAGGAVTGAGPGPRAPQPDPARPAQVALLIPSSAADPATAALARDIEAAARMALDSFAPGTLEMTVHDTAADPARAAAAAERAAAAGARLLLGPVFAQEAAAVAEPAQAAGVTALALTPFSGAVAPSVMVLGFAPENEADRVIGYAASQGLRRLAVVYPRYQYGEIALAAAETAARRHGVQIAGRLGYARSFEGVQSAASTGAGNLLAGAPDAVLVADGGQALESVVSFLDFYDVSPRELRFLGLGQWAGRGRSAGPVGGWFAAVDPMLAAQFADRFRARTGRDPVGVASLGYDAVIAAGTQVEAARRGAAGDPFSRAALAAAPRFEGATGAFRFGADGVVRRALAVLEVAPDGVTVREAAGAAPAS